MEGPGEIYSSYKSDSWVDMSRRVLLDVEALTDLYDDTTPSTWNLAQSTQNNLVCWFILDLCTYHNTYNSMFYKL